MPHDDSPILTSLPPDVMDALDPAFQIKLVIREMHALSSAVESTRNTVKRTMDTAIKAIISFSATLVVVGVSAVLVVGSYRERVDNMTSSLSRLEEQVRQLSQDVAALRARAPMSAPQN